MNTVLINYDRKSGVNYWWHVRHWQSNDAGVCARRREGHDLRTQSRTGQEVIDELRAMKGDALFVKTDVSKAAEVEALVTTTIAAFGRLDYAANIAGIGAYATTVECTEKLWDLLMRV